MSANDPNQVLPRILDHIDLRVPSLAEVRPFYAALLPALGFTKDVSDEKWFQFEAEKLSGANEFFGITESPGHVPGETRIAFWAESTVEVDRLAEIVRRAGARNMEGPGYGEAGYYAIFFEDPCGTRLEICHRIGRSN
jgi:predicted lactoylglutathione lyase